MKSASGSAAGLLLAAGNAAALDETASSTSAAPAVPPVFAIEHQPKILTFDPAKLAGISEKLMRSHWENNYMGAVKTLNAVKKQLASALANKDTPPWAYNDLKREHLIRTGSVVFHELYFGNLGGDGKADAALRTEIGTAFGRFDAWETEFRKIGAGLAGGSGWVVLGFNLHTHAIENYWLADHAHGPAATAPLLVMDMYEHAYQMDYGAAAPKYIDAFFQNIRWDEVSARLATTRSGKSTGQVG
jgi:Fe-Mn family superoxide dismutase